ncbi:FGGY-family carbohydrate kinase [Ponticoccus sp. SC2-23]|uniref:FGGY-family carbohydrate kinase n=1 Tax=Alexandriicola marinus TaxID=2081710 RepID=UPI000FD72E06|nr:FGGY-family carbohydrate kinase [Alexandriicola marinus]MBM1220872.1 FGGY-family carbohydrate kinase [Ponticoccus sp. SC6-9]MBM1225442.1 FGGY-family carbohydrate kinase [Ponticoccus sp. SC6-15]MBM1227625.1 FGGY-family carbohydrate kinase [Ponticoccus sp. SC6-38]MBM1234737.1 FGGY-family carbohydrate kinase [Ponticoccus sp. SC6-45]MBM1238127.1 FGGY-family carbohydrate kinase [Ponticoccus sp. SC6-49]MBM1244240.1 FGGY-family carbohydrate kinase [Ponticoccus sp. SC2-64]MBM1248261.1 FGGY-family
MTYTLGVDIGTYQTKGVLVDDKGRVVAVARRDHEMIVPRPGWAEHRAEEDWWGDFVQVTRDLLAGSGIDPTEIACVATSAIGPCMLPVDGQGRPLMNGVLYGVDTRAEAEITELTDRIGEETILATCGNALTSQSVGPKILWLKRNHPELFDRTEAIFTSTSFLTFRLTGEKVIDHYTAANFSPLYDVDRQDWTDALASDIIALDKLPRLMWSSEIAGTVTPEAAAETGLAPGTPVTCGTIDAAAEAVSVGLTRPGDMMMMYGSTIFIIQAVSGRVTDPRLWYAPWLFEGEHASMAGLATSGTLTHWFRDQFARELPRETAFPDLAREAADTPAGANGILFLPYFSGERTPIHDPRAKGTFFGLNLTHTRGDMYRALLEGIAHGTAHVIETYGEIGQAPTRVLAVGGGTQNAIWLQATSDIGKVPQILREKSIGASYGNAFLAACAAGLAERGDIDRWNPVTQQVEPDPGAALEGQHDLFKRLYLQTKDIMADLS